MWNAFDAKKRTEKEPVSSGWPASGNQALVGPSISVLGELAGEEDVVIQGRVGGTINFKNNNVTIGRHGKVKANIHAKEIRVEGELEGDLFGSERVSVCATGKVRGNIKAPRVVMEDGAHFKGSIDMESRVASVEDAKRNQGGKAVGAVAAPAVRTAGMDNSESGQQKLNTGSGG